MARLAATAFLLAALFAAAPALANAGTAPPVSWCGSGGSTTDRPDAVAGRQIHVVYAYPSDGVDRLSTFGSAIATDLAAVDAWWRGQDPTRTPRFDLANFGCPGTFGSLDISDVKLPHDSAYYYTQSLEGLSQDLVGLGFDNIYKKYLVYFDTPQTLPDGICGEAYQFADSGGAQGYAAVWLAPNLLSGPTDPGCGDMEDPADLGGYSAIVAAHELLHTLGAVPPEAPHTCPTSPGHVCDNPLDIMEPAGSTYWLDQTLLDWNHDDYYAHPGSWWDVQDSQWLRHLDTPTYTVDVQLGPGTAEVDSDVPGVACTPGATCSSTWDVGSSFALGASAAPGYLHHAVWGGACPVTNGDTICEVSVSGDETISVSFPKVLSAAGLTTSYLRRPARVRAALRLSRTPLAGETSLTCRAADGLRPTSHAITGASAVCTWSVPPRLSGKRVSGSIAVVEAGSTLSRSFTLRLPKKL